MRARGLGLFSGAFTTFCAAILVALVGVLFSTMLRENLD